MTDRIGLDWISELPDKAKGRIGTAIAESYLIEGISQNPQLLHPGFRDCEVRVWNKEEGIDGISYIDTTSEEQETLTWIPDVEFRVREPWSDEKSSRIDKKVFAEVKTSTSPRAPASRIPENQSKLAHLIQNEDNIVLAVLLTLESDHILIETYIMSDGEWNEIEFNESE
jgi:hypothetical protein